MRLVFKVRAKSRKRETDEDPESEEEEAEGDIQAECVTQAENTCASISTGRTFCLMCVCFSCVIAVYMVYPCRIYLTYVFLHRCKEEPPMHTNLKLFASGQEKL